MSDLYHPFANLLGIEFVSRDEKVTVCSMPVTESTLNPNKVVHGGVLFSLADTGMGGAIHPTLTDGELFASIEIKMSYFNPVWDGELVCEAKIIKRGKRIVSTEAEIFNYEKLVAKATGSFSIFIHSQTNKDTE
ncbi:PaaI family thioesterase [Caldithrix abyssi]|nr:PaaI family thioesterase [Caldithrix abyssi]